MAFGQGCCNRCTMWFEIFSQIPTVVVGTFLPYDFCWISWPRSSTARCPIWWSMTFHGHPNCRPASLSPSSSCRTFSVPGEDFDGRPWAILFLQNWQQMSGKLNQKQGYFTDYFILDVANGWKSEHHEPMFLNERKCNSEDHHTFARCNLFVSFSHDSAAHEDLRVTLIYINQYSNVIDHGRWRVLTGETACRTWKYCHCSWIILISPFRGFHPSIYCLDYLFSLFKARRAPEAFEAMRDYNCGGNKNYECTAFQPWREIGPWELLRYW